MALLSLLRFTFTIALHDPISLCPCPCTKSFKISSCLWSYSNSHIAFSDCMLHTLNQRSIYQTYWNRYQTWISSTSAIFRTLVLTNTQPFFFLSDSKIYTAQETTCLFQSLSPSTCHSLTSRHIPLITFFCHSVLWLWAAGQIVSLPVSRLCRGDETMRTTAPYHVSDWWLHPLEPQRVRS